MQTTKDEKKTTTAPPPAPINGNAAKPTTSASPATEGKAPRTPKKFFVVNTTNGAINEFASKKEATKFLNDDPTAPKQGEFVVIIGNKAPQRQTVSLG